jgi:hypothetical protein
MVFDEHQIYEDLYRVGQNAIQLFDGDVLLVKQWLYTSNHLFFGLSPYEMILSGRGVSVYEHQEEMLGVTYIRNNELEPDITILYGDILEKA